MLQRQLVVGRWIFLAMDKESQQTIYQPIVAHGHWLFGSFIMIML